MAQLEYLSIFISIILGLGLVDLLESAYRIIRARERVRFHWLPLAWALITFLLVMIFYWMFFHFGGLELWRNLSAFIFLLVGPVMLFLASANVLPEEVPNEDVLDLERFYFDRPRGFFLVLAVYMLHVLILGLLRNFSVWKAEQLFHGAGFLVCMLLVASRSNRVHEIVTIAAFIFITGFVLFYRMELN